MLFWQLSDRRFPLFLVILDTWKAVVQLYTKKFETLTIDLSSLWSKQLKDLVA